MLDRDQVCIQGITVKHLQWHGRCVDTNPQMMFKYSYGSLSLCGRTILKIKHALKIRRWRALIALESPGYELWLASSLARSDIKVLKDISCALIEQS
jgi:hypothetical protein